jgi:hypothetical protein
MAGDRTFSIIRTMITANIEVGVEPSLGYPARSPRGLYAFAWALRPPLDEPGEMG